MHSSFPTTAAVANSRNDHAEAAAINTATSEMLKERTLAIIADLNARKVWAPIARYASPDYSYRHVQADGTPLVLTAAQAIGFFFDKYADADAEGTYFEPRDAVVHLHSDPAAARATPPCYATVWVHGFMRNCVEAGRRERVAVYSWRRERDDANSVDGRRGGEKWVWWRHECPGTAAIMPV